MDFGDGMSLEWIRIKVSDRSATPRMVWILDGQFKICCLVWCEDLTGMMEIANGISGQGENKDGERRS